MRIDYQQLEFIHPILRELVQDVEDATGFEFTITSLYRIGDNGNHGQLPLRAMDLRCRNAVLGAAIEKWINVNWTYDYNRPEMKCCLMHGKGANLHFHLQVHPNTDRA